MFEKKIADKIHKPRRREIVTEILKKEVKFLTRFKHPKLLKVIHQLEECKWVKVNLFFEIKHM